ncbi:hypothetical protein BZA05DRAFT_333453 [Tricharina praecox]|uniref:uncharacterized protein n=1 Tax=Tricharina praecox TaxID=43433 RepID=UPI00221F063E|nr:uncharacterized protein BZA05DRAFT_333453 [Tricharina praecox]KAI5856107.1 hypothetical protein BZA05DRAFT_333453 [Tricharina praecox]
MLTHRRETEYIAWSLPKSPIASSKGPSLEPRAKARRVRVNLIALCSPGSPIFSGKHSHFTATVETRCVRDIKRPHSWKIYGVECGQGVTAHYVRIQLADDSQDSQFRTLVILLDSISAKRHVALSNIHPFGLGVDFGVPSPHSSNRIYLITHCAKTTPYLRKVTVDFEIFLDQEWKRIDLKVDRVGFAVYKSASRTNILLANGPEEIHFAHDPYVRFARMTLRFGERPERTYIDIEDDGRMKEKPCHVTRTRKGSIVHLPKVRVRTCDGEGTTRQPISTMTRLIFSEKDGMPWARSGVAAAAEAEKMASLIRKTARLAAKNPIGVKAAVQDGHIFSMSMKGVIADKGYTVRNVDDGFSFQADIRDKFRGCVVYAVPSLRAGTNGIVLISHSLDGEAVLRQHIDNPVHLISSITESGFMVPCNSTLIRARDNSRSMGKGNIRYFFNYGGADAGVLVEKLVKLVTALDATKLPELTTHLAQELERREQHASSRRSPPPPSPYGHARTPSNVSTSSTSSTSSAYSNLSNTSSASNVSCSSTSSSLSTTSSAAREPSDWDICEDAVFDDAEPARSLRISVAPEGIKAPRKRNQMARAKTAYTARLTREVAIEVGDRVVVLFRNKNWSFVRRLDGENEEWEEGEEREREGWVPTGFLEML